MFPYKINLSLKKGISLNTKYVVKFRWHVYTVMHCLMMGYVLRNALLDNVIIV